MEMLKITKETFASATQSVIRVLVLPLLAVAAFAGLGIAQTLAGLEDKAIKSLAIDQPRPSTQQAAVSIYKGVKIGMNADEIRRILGKAEIDDDDGFFYDEDSEMIQIRLDKDKNVRLIAVTYSSESPNIPKFVDLFGEDPKNAKPDGSIYTLVRYPEAGYWLAYSKTGGDKSGVTVTMQKL